MAVNPYANKVIVDGRTIVDLTGDSVSPADVVSGVTFHDASGAPRTGTYVAQQTEEVEEIPLSDIVAAVIAALPTFNGEVI